METLIFPDASTIPESYVEKLVLPQIQCWWASPHNEYKICIEDTCKRVIWIEEVHKWKENTQVLNDYSNNYCCPECSSDTDYIYESWHFLEVIKEYFTSEVWVILLESDSEEIVWFWLQKHTTIESVVDYEFATRPASYHSSELWEQLSRAIFQDSNAQDESIILFHHIYVDPKVRTATNSFRLLSDLFLKLSRNPELPVIWETRYDANFYAISRSMWFQDLIWDQHWYVTQYWPRYADIQDYITQHEKWWYRWMIWNMQTYKQEAKNILEKYPDLTGPIYYK